jgi:hypothetical protein
VSDSGEAAEIDIPDAVADYARTAAARQAYLFWASYLAREERACPSWEQLPETARALWQELTVAVDDGFSDGLMRGLRLHESGAL